MCIDVPVEAYRLIQMGGGEERPVLAFPIGQKKSYIFSGFAIFKLFSLDSSQRKVHIYYVLCVQELVTHFIYSSYLYKMGHYFLDIQYYSVVVAHCKETMPV